MGEYAVHGRMIGAPALTPALYVVATPIGNLGDVTLRALEVLAGCDLLACEDTRMTARLLTRYGISARTIAYTEHNAAREGPRLVARIQAGEAVALVSDAGTPLMSDPGERLVAAAIAAGVTVHPVPGASAPLAALIASGLPAVPFAFAGFPPHKSGPRRAFLQSFREFAGTLVFFEAPTRLAATLADMVQIFSSDREVAVCRELTKLHEEVRRGTLEEMAVHFGEAPPRGEIVIVLAPAPEGGREVDADRLLTELLAGETVSRAAQEAARLTGLPRRDLYRRALELKDRKD